MANLGRIVNQDTSNRKDLKTEAYSARELIKVINRLNAKYSREYAETVENVTRCLEEKGIRIVNEKEIDEEQKAFVQNLYRQKMMGRTSPICFDNIQIVGSGGNINKLFRLTPKRMRKEDRMMVCSLRKLHTNLSALTVEERMEQYELREDRADVIVPAAELFLMVAEITRAENIIVPTVGLADGVINELAGKN